MKKIIIILSLAFFSISFLDRENRGFYSDFISGEDTILDGSLTIKAYVMFLDSLELLNDINYNLPSGWSFVAYTYTQDTCNNDFFEAGNMTPTHDDFSHDLMRYMAKASSIYQLHLPA
jgi:hypothetical protein